MIFEAAHLKTFLVRTLEPICDAEPGALADYIIALLKHNVPEADMRKELASQLDEFLLEESSPFIDTLFTTLRTKTYIPYAPDSTPSTSKTPGDIAVPSPDRGRKRGAEEEQDGRPSAKGPRLSTEGQFSRYAGNGTGAWGGQQSQQMGQMPTNGRGPQPYRPPDQKKGLCRDYHNNGYCGRGALCKYSHGDEAVVPSQFFPGPPMSGPAPYSAMFGPPGSPYGMAQNPPAYDPHDSRIDTRMPHQRAPIIQRPLDGNGMPKGPGELPVIQDLTPKLPRENQPAPSFYRDGPPHMPGMPVNGMGNMPMHGNGMNMAARPMMDVDMSNNNNHSNGGGFRGGSMRGRGRGTFSGQVHTFPGGERPERRNDKTLVVEKIPEDKLTLEAVNGWFKRFGTVTNVAIDRPSGKALVSFSNHEDAHTAWKSEDAVFSNRFVKLFWHRPMDGHGAVGTRSLAASAPVVAAMSVEPTPNPTPPAAMTPAPTPAAVLRKPSATATSIALASKQAKLEAQISEQKTLMGSLSTASAEEKKTIMARLRKLGEEMKPAAAVPLEQQEKDRLDKELDNRAMTVDAEGGEESTEDLKVKLARLKAEAASLGLPEAAEPYHNSGYRPYRGRGRGAPRGGFQRGAMRGGAARPSMKLDNRPNMKLDNRPKAKSAETTVTAVTTTATPVVSAEKSVVEVERAASPAPSHHGNDEEVVASGWGGGDEDEDGMGML